MSSCTLTLRFIGEVDRPLPTISLRARRSPRRSLDLRILGTGRFEQRNGGALWAGVEPESSGRPH